jgi:putative N6-adenine-specific DNA methylase
MIVMTHNNLNKAGILFEVPLKQIEAQEVKPPSDVPGIMLTNPPYGERIDLRGDSTLETDEMATAFFSAFGTTLKQRFAGWSVFLFSADLKLPKFLRLKESRKTPFFNGALECRLFRFDMVSGYNRREEAKPKTQ